MQLHENGSFIFSPTDLVNFLGCSHSTILDIGALNEHIIQDEGNEYDALLRQMGIDHEANYLQNLKHDGKDVVQIPNNITFDERFRLTNEAMQQGADVIYQAALLKGNWRGFSDFLIKTDRPLVGFNYEITDTKLARQPKVSHLIQLGVYSNLLTHQQASQPEQTHIVLGDNNKFSYLVKDLDSYVHYAMQRLENFAGAPNIDSYPKPCAHCSTCRWQNTCEAIWRNDDHLSLVANMNRTQADKLNENGIYTVRQLSQLPAETAIPDLNPQVFERLRSQAILQTHKRLTDENRLELITFELGRGFSRLPIADQGDLFFDMEGDPLYPKGLEYLFGICLLQDNELVFRSFWAHNHEEERNAFAQFMEFLKGHLEAHPRAYIYHYNHYETTALKRLARHHAVAEHQLDELLRRRKFVDLYQVVRESVRISEPAYSLKNLETFYMNQREGEVARAVDSIVVYNRWRETHEDQLLEQLAAYNKVDCVSTRQLRDWLLNHRPQDGAWFDGSPAEPDADRTAVRLKHEARYGDYQRKLLAEPIENAYRIHLADLLEFHAREERPQWWEHFDRQNRFENELLDDTECIAGLTLTGNPQPVKQSLLYSFQCPSQETKRKAGDKVIDIATLTNAGTIETINKTINGENLIVQIKRSNRNGTLPNNLSIGPERPIPSDSLREAIYRFATDVLTYNNRYPAVCDILNKAIPRINGRHAGQQIIIGEDLLSATTDAVEGLNNSYLIIQGPPGAGKTYTSANVILELIRNGKKVGIAANSHKVIHNLLDMVEGMAKECNLNFNGIKKSSAGNAESIYNGHFIKSQNSTEKINKNMENVLLFAGTAWLFADIGFDQKLDYLFIDEAGQVSVANVIAMGTAAKNIVLVGDQMQLGQPIQGVHPGEAGLSVLEFLLGDQATVALDRGIFLKQTWRLHPTICQFISEAFYEGRLEPNPENVNQQLIFGQPINEIPTQGIRFIPVNHIGCSQKSQEEGQEIRNYFKRLVGQTFIEKDGSTRVMTLNDILVVTPYNIQVNHLKSILPQNARVGTVDKFQGQETPVVLISMVTSDSEYLPRDIDFLFSVNRLNVALSRAKCLAVIFANPKLLETPCRTIEQLKMLNKFCQLVRYSETLENG